MDAGSPRFDQPIHDAALGGCDACERRKPERLGVSEQTERIGVGKLRVLEVNDREVEARGSDEVDDLGGRKLDEEPSNRFAEVQHL
jgi:hypothetical protein